MQNRAILSLVLIFLVLATSSCSRRPKGVLKDAEMVKVLSDIYIAQAIYSRNNQEFPTIEEKDAVMAGVFKKHNLTQDQFNNTLEWYIDNLNDYRRVNDSVAAVITRRQNVLYTKNNMAEAGNQSNHLSYINYFNTMWSFSIDSIKLNSSEIDLAKLNFSFKALGVNKEQAIVAKLYFQYKDTVVSEQISLQNDGYYNLDKPQLPDSLLKKVSGYIKLDTKPADWLSNIIIYNISYQVNDSISEPQ